MASNFRVGDKVMLNVGGPLMAVSRGYEASNLNGNVRTYRCQWYAGKKLESGDFPEQSLIVAPPTQPVHVQGK
jgi:uncharacterized protein YodC (DUF2158 family)